MQSISSRFVQVLTLLSMSLIACAVATASESQLMYRCGNVYTNQPEPNTRCIPLTPGNVTVIEGTRVQGAQVTTMPPNASSPVGSGSTKVDIATQRQRDTQVQAVLQAELQRAQKQHAELLHEWNNGEPERRTDEIRQHKKYQDRVAQLRAALERSEADIAGLQRELSRLPVFNQSGAKP